MPSQAEILRTWAAALRQRSGLQIQAHLAQDVPGRGRCFCAVGAMLDASPSVTWEPSDGMDDEGVLEPKSEVLRRYPRSFTETCDLIGLSENLVLDVIDMNDGTTSASSTTSHASCSSRNMTQSSGT